LGSLRWSTAKPAPSATFKQERERAPNFGNVHDIFEIQRCVYFVAAHGTRLEHSRALLDRHVIANTECGLKLTLAEVNRAHVEQTKLYKRFLAFFEDVDVLIRPAASVPPLPRARLFVEKVQRRENAHLHALACHHLCTDDGTCLRRRARVRCRRARHAVWHPDQSHPTVPMPAGSTWLCRWNGCWHPTQ
jgi:hypothetical protein